MILAYLTGAVASGFTAAGLTALFIWIATVLSGSSDPWGVAPWLVTGAAAVVAVGTYVAEGIVHRRTLARMRSTGEPWAYRSEG
jgi:hypothetical protein